MARFDWIRSQHPIQQVASKVSATFLIKNQNYSAMPNGNHSVRATD